MEPSIIKSFNIARGELTCAIPFIPDKYIASGTNSGTIMLFPLQPDIRSKRLVGHRGSITCISLAKDPVCFATGSEDETVRFWRMVGQDDSCILIEPNDGIIRSISLASEASKILIAGSNSSPSLWDPLSQSQILTFHSVSSIQSVTLSVESNLATLSTMDGQIQIYDVRSGELTRHVDVFSPITCTSLTANGQYLAIGSSTGGIFYCDVGTGFISLSNKTAHASEVNSIAVCPDGSWILSGAEDGSIILSDTVSLDPCFLLNGHKGRVVHTSFSLDGKQFTTCANDQKLLLWSVPSPQSALAPQSDSEEEEDLEIPKPKKAPIPSSISSDVSEASQSLIKGEEENVPEKLNSGSIDSKSRANKYQVRDIPEIAKTKSKNKAKKQREQSHIFEITDNGPLQKNEFQLLMEKAAGQMENIYTKVHSIIQHMQKIESELENLEVTYQNQQQKKKRRFK